MEFQAGSAKRIWRGMVKEGDMCLMRRCYPLMCSQLSRLERELMSNFLSRLESFSCILLTLYYMYMFGPQMVTILYYCVSMNIHIINSINIHILKHTLCKHIIIGWV